MNLPPPFRIGYGEQKVKHFKESINDLVATACDFNKEEILSDDPTCQKCTNMGRLINAITKKILARNGSRYKNLQLLQKVGQLEEYVKNLKFLSI